MIKLIRELKYEVYKRSNEQSILGTSSSRKWDSREELI